jgi:SAM-dependent methyltransferase
MAIGWCSPVIDAHYAELRREHGTSKKMGATAFASFDQEAFRDRYAEKFSRIAKDLGLQKAVGQPRPTFLDLGCAPGGVSLHLHRELQWSGVGVSLSVRDGGVEMAYRPSRDCDGPKFCFVEESVFEATRIREVIGHEFTSAFSFCNGGAVTDQGQRSAGVLTEGSEHLPEYNRFLWAQLSLCLEHVADGGDVMFVHGVPDCITFVLLIDAVRPLAKGGVRFYETIHGTKAPVYVVLRRVEVDERAVAAVREVLHTTLAHICSPTDDMMARAKLAFAEIAGQLEPLWGLRQGKLLSKRLDIERRNHKKRPREGSNHMKALQEGKSTSPVR